ncbi:NADH-quinone oxidoreductase subunit M [Opitutales bacterium ASA1]|uniref:complex I subunit 4 family protein n=1 Tax=Congregicoccus parvus TaxID=3081749 RepID=UPI002B2FCB43|nr:NADH-quinone oxidoreductase subunit M [Opitutales bacterium ASA1]
MSEWPLLSLIVFLPIAGGLLLALLPRMQGTAVRAIALAASGSTLVLAAVAAMLFEPHAHGYQLGEYRPWIEALAVNYRLGIDGMSLMLVVLTALVAPGCLVAGWGRGRDERVDAAWFLLLQGSALGVFLSLDFFLWFLFWEASLVPAFFLVRSGGGERAGRAAYAFVVYTLTGSAGLLLGFVALRAATGSFDFEQLAALGAEGETTSRLAEVGGARWVTLVFAGVLAGVAVKAPLFPFHTWMPATYAEAPTGTAMFLTAVMSKMGVYGFFRLVWPLFPEQLRDASGLLLVLALAGVVFGAFAALGQNDLKRMLAYSSLNHVSYCLVGLFAAVAPGAAASANAVPAALNGALLQMFNHGLSAAALFFFVGALEARSGGRRGIDDFGGARRAAPVLAGMCGVAMFSSIGVPGLNGFVGEFLVFRGLFGVSPWGAAAGCIGLLVTAIFLLGFQQRVFHGPAAGAVAEGRITDLSTTEVAATAPLVVFMFVLGLAPQLLLGWINPLTATWAAGGIVP